MVFVKIVLKLLIIYITLDECTLQYLNKKVAWIKNCLKGNKKLCKITDIVPKTLKLVNSTSDLLEFGDGQRLY